MRSLDGSRSRGGTRESHNEQRHHLALLVVSHLEGKRPPGSAGGACGHGVMILAPCVRHWSTPIDVPVELGVVDIDAEVCVVAFDGEGGAEERAAVDDEVGRAGDIPALTFGEAGLDRALPVIVCDRYPSWLGRRSSSDVSDRSCPLCRQAGCPSSSSPGRFVPQLEWAAGRRPAGRAARGGSPARFRPPTRR